MTRIGILVLVLLMTAGVSYRLSARQPVGAAGNHSADQPDYRTRGALATLLPRRLGEFRAATNEVVDDGLPVTTGCFDILPGGSYASTQGSAVRASYTVKNSDPFGLELARVTSTGLPAMRGALQNAPAWCRYNADHGFEDLDTDTGKYVFTRIDGQRVGDTSARYRVTGITRGYYTTFIAAYDVLALSRSWYLQMHFPEGFAPALRERALSQVTGVLDAKLQTAFHGASGGRSVSADSCPEISDHLSNGARMEANFFEQIAVIHDALCRRDVDAVAHEVNIPFGADTRNLGSRDSAATWARSLSGTPSWTALQHAFENPGRNIKGQTHFQSGSVAAIFGRERINAYQLPWLWYTDHCDANSSGGPCRIAQSTPLAQARWASVIDDLGCDTSWGEGGRVLVDAESYGDVNGDAIPDAVIAASCATPTSSAPEKVEVFDGASNVTDPRRLATLLDYKDGTDVRGIRVTAVVIKDAKITVRSFGYADMDPNSTPSHHVVDTFHWRNGGFVHDNRQVT
ncbi:MAG TPA: hypothetical protein VGL93_08805 [Streptosporangiaceae bacterium]